MKRQISLRAIILLAALTAVALGLALLNSTVVPREWNDWLPAPRLAFGVVAARPPFTEATPGPGVTPAPTPNFTEPIPLPPGRDREGRGLGFGGGFFEAQRALVTGFGGYVAGLLLLLSAGLLTLYAIPRRIGVIASAFRGGVANVARLALVGMATYAILAVLGVLAAASVLGGITVLFMTLVLYIAALLGVVAISLPLGRLIGRRFGLSDQAPLVDLLAGLLVVFIVSLLPFVGVLALAVLAITGFGALVQTRAGSARGWDFSLNEVEY